MDNITFLKAVEIATKAHVGQTRADGKTPYILHPIRVATLVSQLGITFESSDRLLNKNGVVIAALLHDVLEDSGKSARSTKFYREDLSLNFGHAVAKVVEELTQDQSMPKDQRRALMIEHCGTMSFEAKTIKLADRLDNMRDMASMSRKFIDRYCDEATQMLERMKGTCPSFEDEIREIILKSQEPPK